LPQAHEALEDGEGVLLHRLVGVESQQRFLNALELVFVELHLDAFHLRVNLFFGPWRKVLGDLELGAAEQERPEARGEAALAERVLALVEAFLEIRAAAEHAGHGEGHQRPHVEQAVFDRRSGEDQAVLGIQLAGALGGLGVRVLDLLAFVKDGGEPLDAVEFLAADAELGVVEDEDVDVVLDVLDVDVVPVLEDLDLELRGEFPGFAVPNVEHGLGADDERRLFHAAGLAVFLEQPEQIGERLDGFPESHVVGEYAAEIVDTEVGEELEAIHLIGAESGVESFW
jgi:hypothetical protein